MSIKELGCPYCSMQRTCPEDSLATKYPNVVDIWSDKNIKTPFEYAPTSGKVVWWDCGCGVHNSYKRKISESQKVEFRCPECVREMSNSILQNKISSYIIEEYEFALKHEKDCPIIPRHPNYPKDARHDMPFDNYIEEVKLLCECHGKQHYDKRVYETFWIDKNKSSEEQLAYQQWKDEYKKQYALSHGYNYVSIPYWEDDKQETWKTTLNNKISEILLARTLA